MIVGPQRAFSRRSVLLSTAALFVAGGRKSYARVISGSLPWEPNSGSPVDPIQIGPWKFFTDPEGRSLDALADRIIPADPETPGGRDSGCAVFVDRQLAGPYGAQDGLYVRPPFQKGSVNQGPQSKDGPRQQYRQGLAALDQLCRAKYDGKAFADLADTVKDEVLHGLESGSLALDPVDGKAFFAALVRDIQMGFFADPIYGGNRDMVAWKMIGYPGARYNYRDWVNRHNERFPLPPVGITGSIDWNPKKAEAR
jgi:gluconate 2-dehydrogenase gamma chain